MGHAGQGAMTICGRVLHMTAPDRVVLHEQAGLRVDATGRIEALQPQFDPRTATGAVVRLEPGQLLIPGLVDLHVHAPQWRQAGRALELPLERWLQDCTFPLEARCGDLEHARTLYDDLVGCLLANGTTTSVYFATIHEAASLALAEICLARGQRGFVGRVAMDDPDQCPPDYRDASAAAGIAATRRFIERVRALPGNEGQLVRPLVTPRFIPACSDALLQGLGRLAAETDCAVQTHCSESDWEAGYVRARLGRSDTQALDSFGLLRPGSILAHGTLIEPADLDLIAARQAGIAHCPLSNAFFSDAVFGLRRALAHGVAVGLGTDIAGGFSPQLLDNARQAVIVSRLLESGTDASQPVPRRGGVAASRVDCRTAFWLATGGGGQALRIPVGQFRPGFSFDAVLIDSSPARSNLRLAADDSADDIVQKLVCHAGRADMISVWVQGRRVHQAV